MFCYTKQSLCKSKALFRRIFCATKQLLCVTKPLLCPAKQLFCQTEHPTFLCCFVRQNNILLYKTWGLYVVEFLVACFLYWWVTSCRLVSSSHHSFPPLCDWVVFITSLDWFVDGLTAMRDDGSGVGLCGWACQVLHGWDYLYECNGLKIKLD